MRLFACLLPAACLLLLIAYGPVTTHAEAGDDPKPKPPKKAQPKDPKKAPPKAEPPAPPRPPMPRLGGPLGEQMRLDLEELVKRGGRLPEGFRPHLMGPGPFGPRGGPTGGSPLTGSMGKAFGKLILNYLEAKDDPVKAAVYEDLLRDLAKGLVAGQGANPQTLGASMMGKFLQGMQDPKKRPAYEEIMRLFGEAMAGAMPDAVPRPAGTPAPPPPPTAGTPDTSRPPRPPTGPSPYRGVPRKVGEADVLVWYMAGVYKIYLGAVPPGSPAAQAGLAAGDEILSVDGKPVDSAGLSNAAKVLSKGGKLMLKIKRKDGKIELLEIEAEVVVPPDRVPASEKAAPPEKAKPADRR